MSKRAVRAEWAGSKAGKSAGGSMKLATAIAERDMGDSMLRFLSQLARFGLAAGRDPLLKPAKPGN